MAQDITTPEEAPLGALELLSLPTQEITDKQLELIVIELRRKREAFAKTGELDKAPKAKAAPKAKLTAEDKKANTLSLLSQLTLPSIKKD